MAVGFGTSSTSHASGSSSASQASFTWNHDSTGDRCAVVFVVTIAATDNGSSVTFGGVSMSSVGTGADSSGEPGTVKAYFLDNITQGASTAIVVSRTNNATVMFAFAMSFTALGACETTGLVTVDTTTTAAPSEANVDDGSPGTNSMRCACV
jgi:hypothetical protein